MRRKSSKLNPSKAKGSLLMAKTKKQKKKQKKKKKHICNGVTSKGEVCNGKATEKSPSSADNWYCYKHIKEYVKFFNKV